MRFLSSSDCLTWVQGGDGMLQIEGSALTNTITSAFVYQEQITPTLSVGAQANASTSGQRDWKANVTLTF